MTYFEAVAKLFGAQNRPFADPCPGGGSPTYSSRSSPPPDEPACRFWQGSPKSSILRCRGVLQLPHFVQVPVADLRREPIDLLPKDYSHHKARDSQLLYGEKVRLIRAEGPWLYVEALEQELFNEERGWHPYPGWVHMGEIAPCIDLPPPNAVVVHPWVIIEPFGLQLSYGTYLYSRGDGHILLPDGREGMCRPTALRPLNLPFSRERLLEDAHHFLDAPYLWGGRGAFDESGPSSVDCSGLTNLLYRAQGISIPRDAHDQFLKAKKVTREELQAGDLIFLTRIEKPTRITHVVLHCDSETFIEAPETGRKVARLSFATPLAEIVQLQGRPYTFHAYFGSFL